MPHTEDYVLTFLSILRHMRANALLSCHAIGRRGYTHLHVSSYVTMLRLAAIIATVILTSFPFSADAQTCKSFKTCEEAMKSYRAGNTKLDRDKDGIPCESLCGDK